MIKRTVSMLAIVLILSGCAVGTLPQRGGPIAWDGLGRDPNLRPPPQRRHLPEVAVDPTIEEDARLADLAPRSSEFFAALRKIEADRDKRLGAKLIICNGCSVSASKTEPSDGTLPNWISDIR